VPDLVHFLRRLFEQASTLTRFKTRRSLAHGIGKHSSV
jgi:hypothetical protein